MEEGLNEGTKRSRNAKFDEALTFYDQALAVQPDNFRALSFKGCALMRLERYDEAQAVLEQGITVAYDYNPIRLNLVKTYCSNGDRDKAVALLAKLGPPQKIADLLAEDHEFKQRCGDISY